MTLAMASKLLAGNRLKTESVGKFALQLLIVVIARNREHRREPIATLGSASEPDALSLIGRRARTPRPPEPLSRQRLRSLGSNAR